MTTFYTLAINSHVFLLYMIHGLVCATIIQLQRTATTEEVQALLQKDDFDFRFQCGYCKPTTKISIGDKDALIHAIWLHHVLFHPYAELEQLRKGLRETLQIELLVCLHAKELVGVLAASTAFDVTVEYLQGAFLVNYKSDPGANERTKEEAIVYNWYEYISDCKGASIQVSKRLHECRMPRKHC